MRTDGVPWWCSCQLVFGLTAAVCLSFFVAVAWRGEQGTFIQGDGAYYYAWTRSVLLDGDVNFTNEYWLTEAQAEAARALIARTTPKGLPQNKYSVGLPMIETVPAMVARLTEWLIRLPPTERPGYGPAYQWTVALFLWLGGLAVLYIAFRHLETTAGRSVAFLLACGTLGATNLLEYLTRGITYTHLTDVALVFAVWLVTERTVLSARWYAWLGFLVGLTVVTRYTNTLAMPWALACLWARGHRPRWQDAVAFGVGMLLPLGVQVAANVALWGIPFPEPYAGYGFQWIHPRLWDSLLSVERGWLLWHRWYALLLVLFSLSWGHYRPTGVGRAVYAAAVVACIGMWYVNSAWSVWQFGFSFGNRGYLALTPVLTVTIATAAPTLLGRIRGPTQSRVVVAIGFGIVIAFVLWNVNLWLGFVLAAVRRGCLQPPLADCVLWLVKTLTGRPWLPCGG
jgi:hypothetical protein